MAGPLYMQITDDLRSQIESGELKEEERIPTEDQLMKLYRASRNTVRRAVTELSTRRLVETRHGKGTFVSKRVSPIVTTLSGDPEKGPGGGEGLVYTAEVAKSGRSPSKGEFSVGRMKASPAVARHLEIPEDTVVIIRYQQLLVDKLPWSLESSYYPKSLSRRAPRLEEPEDIAEGTVAYMRACGIGQDGYQDAIEWRAPNKAETDYFDLRAADGHVQVVERRRIAFDQDGKRIRLTITIYRADRNRFVINVGNVPEGATH